MHLRHQQNSNLSLHHIGPWQGYEVQLQHGPLVSEYLALIKQTMDLSLLEHPRMLAVRIDLRLPINYAFQHERLMSRFIQSLRAQVQADLDRRRSEGKRAHNTSVRYVWARELDTGHQPHYHVCLFFNKDAYRQVGLLSPGRVEGAAWVYPDAPQEPMGRKPARSLAERIRMAWASALGLRMEEALGLVHFPFNGVYRVNARSGCCEIEVAGLFNRLSYMAKAKTKQYGMRERHFGASRG